MSEKEQFESEEKDDVEAHRRRFLTDDEPAAQEDDSDGDGDEDVEAHRRRA